MIVQKDAASQTRICAEVKAGKKLQATEPEAAAQENAAVNINLEIKSAWL